MNFLYKDIHIRSMENFTWNMDIHFVTVIRTSIQGNVYGYSARFIPQIFMIPAPPPPPQQTAAVLGSSAYFACTPAIRWEYYNSN